MLSLNHHLFLYTKLMTVLNKEDWQSMHEIKTMSHHSQHHLITECIFLRCTAVNEFYRMIRMGVAGHVRGPGGHSITKHTEGWLEGLSQKTKNINPK